MNIAVIAKTRLPIVEPFRGGLEAFTHMICTEYIRSGHSVTLYAHADSDPALNVKSFYGDEYRDDENFELYENDEYLSIVRDIERNDFDIVHNNSTHELPIIWGVKAPIPVVTTLHTPPISKLKAAIAMASYSNNLHFIMISKSFESTWRPYLNRVPTVIYNGVDLNLWPLTRKNKDYLFWYGRIVPAKGLDIALDVAHEVGMPIVFAGSCDNKEYFEQQIKPRMMRTDVYAGHLKQPEILARMDGAAALVSAIRWEEPFGLTNIEAMAAGVPVAGFDRGAFRELINQRSGVVAKSNNVVGLAEAVKRAVLLESTIVSQQAERFSLKGMTQSYINYFQGIL